MKNITQTFKRFYFLPIFLLFFITAFGQNSFNSNDGWGAGWGTGSSFTNSAGSSLIYTATNISGSGNRYFRFYGTGTPCGEYGPQFADQQLQTEVIYNNTTLTCGSTFAYYLNVLNNTDNYVFKSASSTAAKIIIFKVQGAIRAVSTVSQSPLASADSNCGNRTVTATLDGALSTGQAVYLRYTKDAWATSTVVAMTGSATTYTGVIPPSVNLPGTTVTYYVFTSGTTAPSSSDADFFTINLNSNSGSNYSYTVSGATTLIPDPKFEQALIDLGLDCEIDGKVFTNNINGLTLLDVRNKMITDLTGIKAFTSLQKLYCQNEGTVNANAITSLDVSGLAQLRFFYCQDNLITNLNLTGLVSLEALDTSNNPLSGTTLNVNVFPNLYYLVCQNNGFTTLDVSSLTNLDTLVVWDNSLSTLNLSNNPNITYLDCDDNLFTTLNVSNLTDLSQFYCSGNDLSSIDIRGLSNLSRFECSNNPSLTCILVDDVIAATSNANWYKPSGAVYSYCDCAKTTTWNGTSWSPIAPIDGQYAAIISGNYSGSANINACSLTVNNNAIVSIPSGTNVKLNAPVFVEAGSSFTIGNNANLIQTNKNSINSGNITVRRNSNPLFRSDYTLWSSPVAGQNLLSFSPETISTRFYIYNSSTNLYNTIAPSNSFAKANGYLIRMPNTDPKIGYDAGSATLDYEGVFSGVPNNGTVSLIGLASNVYHAVGNPYPSTISANDFINGNITDGTLYFWRKTNGVANTGSAYASYTTLGGTAGSSLAPNNVAPNGSIQVGQGFIVKTGVAATELKFTNAMRELTPTSTQFFKTKQGSELSRIWLNLTNSSGVFSQALIGYMNGATLGFDHSIDGRYINDSSIALTSNINGEEFTIQGRPAFDPTDVVALNFKTDVAGDYTIAINNVDGIFANGQDMYLVDNKTATETNLKTAAYTFTAKAEVDNTRFSLKYQKTLKVDALVFNENSVTVYRNNEILNVSSASNTISKIKVFDIQGRLLAEQNNVKSNTATIKNLKAKDQVLIVQVTSEDGKVVNKKVVN